MPPNRARGEVSATLGGRSVRLCVTLGGLAAMETHFGVSGFDALAERLKTMGPGDLMAVLGALAVDGEVPDKVGVGEGIAAVVAAFEAMHG